MEHPKLDQSHLYPLSMSWASISSMWLEKKSKEVKPAPYGKCVLCMGRFNRWLGHQAITPSTLHEFEEWLKATKRGPRMYLKVIRECYVWAIHQSYAARNPFREFIADRNAITRRPHKRISHEEWEKIANKMAYHRWRWLPVWVGCYETAMAAADVVRLRWGQINTREWTITKIREKMVNRNDGIPFTTAVDPSGRFYGHIREAAAALKQDKGLTPSQAPDEFVFPHLVESHAKVRHTNALKAWLERHGCPAYTFHDLRVSRISAMVDSGAPIHVIQKISGHSNPAQVLDYVRATQGAQVEAIIHSNSWSRRTSASPQPPSPSAPTGCLILSDSASGQPGGSSGTTSQSSSRTTPLSRQEWLRTFAGTKRFVSSPLTPVAPTAQETGKYSWLEEPGLGSAGAGSPSS